MIIKTLESSSLETRNETKMAKKGLYTLLGALLIIAALGVTYGIIGAENSLRELHNIRNLFEKAGSSLGVFVVGTLAVGCLYAAIKLIHLLQKSQQKKVFPHDDVPQNKEIERFLLKVLISLVAIGAIAAIVIPTVKGAADTLTNWDHPEVLIAGAVAGLSILGTIFWISWMRRKEETLPDSFAKVDKDPGVDDPGITREEDLAAKAAKSLAAAHERVEARYKPHYPPGHQQ